MKRSYDDGDDDNSQDNPYKKFKPRSYSKTDRSAKPTGINPADLGTADRDVYDKLKLVNKDHPLWTWFDGDGRTALNNVVTDTVDADTFNNLKATYVRAQQEKDARDVIKKANEDVIKAALARSSSPKANDKDSFIIAFMSIGSGDCIFMRTPAGDTVVIDCGQRKSPSDPNYQTTISDVLVGPNFLNGRKKELHTLILSHPDLDHYNEVTRIIEPVVSKVNNLFFTIKKSDYAENKTFDYMDKAGIVNRVSINTAQVSLESSAGDDWKKLYPVTGKSIRVVNESSCSIDLLSGEVVKAYADTEANAASIVTLVQVYGRKILLCADATYSTEDFLTANHTNLLKNVDLMELEHHGSGTEHAGDNFVKLVNPYLAAISSGPHEGDTNPRWKTVEKYVNATKLSGRTTAYRLCNSMDEHDIKCGGDDGWLDMAGSEWRKTYKAFGVYSTDSNGHLYFTINSAGDLIREVTEKKTRTIYKISKTGAFSKDVVNI
ncbi:ComEC/Rec2 family competence protein [Methylomonas sp. HYX-M1]|uniref:ComEC/Rec2 family competence protein n=1 Tax=Methylomonas sp. HYX-M1 TaxID=3139307 RepID=UPI00345C4C95